MPRSRFHIGIVAAFAALYVIWGSTYLAVAEALRTMPPFLLMGTRSIAGGVILLACARLAGGRMATLKSWIHATIYGALFFVGCHGVLAYAQQRAPSGLSAVLLATIPFWIALLKAVLPGDERPRTGTLGLLLPGLAGVGLIAWRQIGAGAAGTSAGDILLLLGAAASWAAGTVLSERDTEPVSPAALSGMELVAGGLMLLMLSLGLGETNRFDPAEVSLVSFASWLYLTAAGTVVAFGTYIWLLRQVSPTLVATYTFVNPIIAVLLGWLVLGEQPTLWMIAGAALVIASVAGLLLARHGSGKVKARPQAPRCNHAPLTVQR
jgi:drug/metabolite transporter (DMT)-like permease